MKQEGGGFVSPSPTLPGAESEVLECSIFPFVHAQKQWFGPLFFVLQARIKNVVIFKIPHLKLCFHALNKCTKRNTSSTFVK